MDWSSIWQVALTAIVSSGGIGAIVVAVIKSSAKILSEQMNEKLKTSLNKELDKIKIDLSKKEYISRIKFDTEYQIYRELSGSFFDLVREVKSVVPGEDAAAPAAEDASEKLEEKAFFEARDVFIKARDLLQKDAPFITEQLFDSFETILHLCEVQISVIQGRGKLKPEDHDRTKAILDKHSDLQKELRNYLSSLEIAE